MFSLLDTSSCSYDKREWTWTFKGLNVYHQQATFDIIPFYFFSYCDYINKEESLAFVLLYL